MVNTVKRINPFVKRVDGYVDSGVGTGEKYYYDHKIKLVYVDSNSRDPDTGDVLANAVPKVITTKTDIDKLINSHKNEVGLKNLIRIFSRTGDASLFNQKKPLPDGDYTSLGDVEALFSSLPEDLKAGKNLKEFMDSFSLDLFKKYLVTLKAGKKVDTVQPKDGGDDNE